MPTWLIAISSTAAIWSSLLSGEPLAGGQPAGAVGPQLGHRSALVLGRLLGRQHLAPAAVDALVDEHLGAGVPEGAVGRHGLAGMAFHPVERAVLDDRLPARRIDRD